MTFNINEKIHTFNGKISESDDFITVFHVLTAHLI